MLKIENLSFGYNGFLVLKDINWSVEGGEMVGLIGPNASGKTTLLKTISGVLKPFAGRIFIDGQNVRKITAAEMARMVAVVPQNPSLPPAFSAFEIVLMGRTPHLGLLRYESVRDFEIAWQAMESTRTQHLTERRAGELSGGERQRLIIARALAQQPQIMLLDEPTANLDLSHQIEILNLMKELSRKQRLTIILALHDLNLAAQYCERILLLDKGKIFIEGSPEKVINSENIRQVYGVEVLIQPHPLNGRPVIIGPVSHEIEAASLL